MAVISKYSVASDNLSLPFGNLKTYCKENFFLRHHIPSARSVGLAKVLQKIYANPSSLESYNTNMLMRNLHAFIKQEFRRVVFEVAIMEDGRLQKP